MKLNKYIIIVAIIIIVFIYNRLNTYFNYTSQSIEVYIKEEEKAIIPIIEYLNKVQTIFPKYMIENSLGSGIHYDNRDYNFSSWSLDSMKKFKWENRKRLDGSDTIAYIGYFLDFKLPDLYIKELERLDIDNIRCDSLKCVYRIEFHHYRKFSNSSDNCYIIKPELKNLPQFQNNFKHQFQLGSYMVYYN